MLRKCPHEAVFGRKMTRIDHSGPVSGPEGLVAWSRVPDPGPVVEVPGSRSQTGGPEHALCHALDSGVWPLAEWVIGTSSSLEVEFWATTLGWSVHEVYTRRDSVHEVYTVSAQVEQLAEQLVDGVGWISAHDSAQSEQLSARAVEQSDEHSFSVLGAGSWSLRRRRGRRCFWKSRRWRPRRAESIPRSSYWQSQ